MEISSIIVGIIVGLGFLALAAAIIFLVLFAEGMKH